MLTLYFNWLLIVNVRFFKFNRNTAKFSSNINHEQRNKHVKKIYKRVVLVHLHRSEILNLLNR